MVAAANTGAPTNAVRFVDSSLLTGGTGCHRWGLDGSFRGSLPSSLQAVYTITQNHVSKNGILSVGGISAIDNFIQLGSVAFTLSC